jgi:diacylglycerol O-acyltransferase
MDLMSPTDAVFLMTESREHPMHVGGLQLFEPPEGAGGEFARETYEALIAHRDMQPTFRKRPARLFGGIGNIGWAYDDEDDIDVGYHVRRSALPSPGRVRDLLEMTSLLHGTLLDRHRPLWEAHLVEGLSDGRFALYTKFHHALIDGVSAVKLMQRSLSTDPHDPEVGAIWNLPRRRRSGGPSRLQTLTQTAKSIAGLGPSTWSLARAALVEHQLTLPFSAPRTMLNVRIGGARRCAAQSWSLDRIKNIKHAAGVTVNDVVLAMCAGNMVGSILCNLATDVEDPAKRLETISESMRGNKKVFSELPRLHAFALSAFLIAPLGLTAIPGFVSSAPPPFNIVISNVPGPTEPMYWGGARLDGNYPLSIALDGQALNITVVNNAGNIDFGLVGCRRSVPHLQQLLGHLETSLKDLERAAGV